MFRFIFTTLFNVREQDLHKAFALAQLHLHDTVIL